MVSEFILQQLQQQDMSGRVVLFRYFSRKSNLPHPEEWGAINWAAKWHFPSAIVCLSASGYWRARLGIYQPEYPG